MNATRATWNLLGFAARNLLRNKSRTAITSSAILLGCFGSVTLSSFGNGIGELAIRDTVDSKVGAIQVHRAGYGKERGNLPLDITLPASGPLYDQIAATPGVRAVARRIVFGGMVNNGSQATMFAGRAVDPANESRALRAASQDVIGEPLTEHTPSAGIFGQELADAMGVKRGDLVTLQAATAAGRQNALDITITGSLDNVNVFESKRLIHVPLAFAQDLLGMPNEVTEIVIGVHDIERIDAIAEDLRARLGGDYEVETWAELQPNVRVMVRFQAIIIGIVSVVFLVIVVFGVMNTMFMSVMERTREIGTIMALGLQRDRIRMIFLAEAAILATLGATLGIVLALGVVEIVTARGGIPFAAPGSTVERYHLLPIPLNTWLTVSFVASIAGAMLAAAYPAHRAARMRPVEALRVV